jgi:lysophospholipase L1-like esterase
MPKYTPPLLAALALALLSPAAAQAATPKQLYVSLGDSYSVGWQRASQTDAGPTTAGYANRIVALARHKHLRYELVNFGCGGATTKSILKTKGCKRGLRAIGGAPYSTSQIAAAEHFLRANRGRVGLITVAIGGNDVTACATQADPINCVGAATKRIKAHVTTLAKRLRAAAGPTVRIVGLTYPDVILGQWVLPPVNQDFAKLSVTAFKLLINPTLKAAYAGVKGDFVDVTEATGAYGSLDATTTLDPYGTIPIPVAKVCELTSYCRYGDIHANASGYETIAKLVVATLARH